MAKTIAMIMTSEGNYVFVKGFNSKHEIVFRTSMQPQRVQHETFKADPLKGLLFLNSYTLPIERIQSFVDQESGVLIVNEELDAECMEGHVQ